MLVQAIAWYWTGDKPLSEPTLTHYRVITTPHCIDPINGTDAGLDTCQAISKHIADKEFHIFHHTFLKPTVNDFTWWQHQTEIFSALLALCAGNSPVTGEFPSQRPVTRSFDVYFDLRLNKRLDKRHCSGMSFCWPDDVIQNGWQDLAGFCCSSRDIKCCNISRVFHLRRLLFYQAELINSS